MEFGVVDAEAAVLLDQWGKAGPPVVLSHRWRGQVRPGSGRFTARPGGRVKREIFFALRPRKSKYLGNGGTFHRPMKRAPLGRGVLGLFDVRQA